MRVSRRLLLVHAHPDDESIGTGTTMARYVAEGAQVTLVTCTLGEEGEVIIDELGHLAATHSDTLGDHRQVELANAMRELGVTDHRQLGAPGKYRDSGMVGTPSNDRGADSAVRAALSRLGCPYVWGAEGPDRFDCSGLVQWAYERAGIRLHRTTYDQINDGMPISPAQVRPGDLVFPHAGHVQLAIGDNLVVEAPYPGATVQISRMGPNVAIRRPV